jgi:hypothetical protein
MNKHANLKLLVSGEQTPNYGGLENKIPNLSLVRLSGVFKGENYVAGNYGLPNDFVLQYAKKNLSVDSTHCLFWD